MFDETHLAVAIRGRFHRHPFMAWFGGWRQWLVVGDGCIVWLCAASRADFLEDAAVFSGVRTGLLRICHDTPRCFGIDV